ncbi:MAG: ubiquitin-like small modifier protein 1 [Halovenus sp.]
MEIELRFFANFRDIVGQKTITREYGDTATIGDIMRALSAEYPEMELFADDGTVRDYLTIMKDGRDITYIDGLDTELESNSTVSLFPPVAGG